MTMSPLSFGGDERIRTADPHVANVVLSQLSYCPEANSKIGKPAGKVKSVVGEDCMVSGL